MDLLKPAKLKKQPEADGAESLLAQLTKDVSGQFDDVKGSISSLRSASLGFIAKAKESSEQTFSDLVEKGQTEGHS